MPAPSSAVCEIGFEQGSLSLIGSSVHSGGLSMVSGSMNKSSAETIQPRTDQKLYAHMEATVKRREPTIKKLNQQYNKLCKDIATLIKQKKAPAGSIAPRPIPGEHLWHPKASVSCSLGPGLPSSRNGILFCQLNTPR
jgi:hypothetical protein